MFGGQKRVDNMFFILSKLFVFLLKPLNWAIILLLVSLFLRTKKWRARTRISAAAILFFFSNPFIVNQLALAWEMPPRQISEIPDSVDFAIILGGYYGSDLQATEGLPPFSMAVNRFISTYQLYKMGRVRKFLLTGGAGGMFGNKQNEADKVHDLLRSLGIPEADILVENQARNTRENALFTKILLDKTKPGASCLLITSAFHMPRAVMCFEKVGQKTMPFPVDFYGKPFQWRPGHTIEPDDLAFFKWNAIIKEWMGIAAYKIKGYI